MTWPPTQIPDNLDHQQAFTVRFSDHHLNTKPIDNGTQIYHPNTRLVQYIQMVTAILSSREKMKKQTT